MKTKKLVIAVGVAMLAVVLANIASASACSWLTLPSTPVTLEITNETYLEFPFIINLSDFPAGTYSIKAGIYTGWCIEFDAWITLQVTYQTMLYSSLNLPAGFRWSRTQLNMVNYILNHKQGSAQDVQVAIWLALGYDSAWIASATGWTISSTATAMYKAAKCRGSCFSPDWDDIVAIVCVIRDAQTVMIEYRRTCFGYGCSLYKDGCWHTGCWYQRDGCYSFRDYYCNWGYNYYSQRHCR